MPPHFRAILFHSVSKVRCYDANIKHADELRDQKYRAMGTWIAAGHFDFSMQRKHRPCKTSEISRRHRQEAVLYTIGTIEYVLQIAV